MTIEALSPGIWLTQVSLADYDARGAVVIGDRRALVWDTLSHPRDMQPCLPLITGHELVIAYSHADWDHIWGTGALPYQHARVVAHDVALGRFETDVPAALAKKQATEPGAWDDVVLVAPGEGFEQRWSCDLGGRTLEMHHLPGHTLDSSVGFIPELGVLLAGDTVETPCPVVPANSPLAAWISELRRWAADDRVTMVVPAHGPIGGREILEQNIAYLEGVLTGRTTKLPEPLTPFYRATHLKNMRWTGPGDGPSSGPGYI